MTANHQGTLEPPADDAWLPAEAAMRWAAFRFAVSEAVAAEIVHGTGRHGRPPSNEGIVFAWGVVRKTAAETWPERMAAPLVAIEDATAWLPPLPAMQVVRDRAGLTAMVPVKQILWRLGLAAVIAGRVPVASRAGGGTTRVILAPDETWSGCLDELAGTQAGDALAAAFIGRDGGQHFPQAAPSLSIEAWHHNPESAAPLPKHQARAVPNVLLHVPSLRKAMVALVSMPIPWLVNASPVLARAAAQRAEEWGTADRVAAGNAAPAAPAAAIDGSPPAGRGGRQEKEIGSSAKTGRAPTRKRGGNDYRMRDRLLFPKIAELLRSGAAPSTTAAVHQLVKQATAAGARDGGVAGRGNDESRIKRVVDRFNAEWDREQNQLRPEQNSAD